MTEQQKNMDYLNSTGEKFMRSLPRAKSDQLRTKLTDLNHKWSELNTMAEKRIVQVHKAVNQNKQYSEEMKGLFKWMDECCDFVKNQAPAAGDPETLEAQLDQSEVILVMMMMMMINTMIMIITIMMMMMIIIIVIINNNNNNDNK